MAHDRLSELLHPSGRGESAVLSWLSEAMGLPALTTLVGMVERATMPEVAQLDADQRRGDERRGH